MTEEATYTYDYWPETDTVYLIYGAVGSDEDNPIDAFAAEMFAFIEANEVDRLIIDVRNNGGGDNTFNAPLVHGVIASRVNRPGGVYVLTGRQTFSAAQNFANWMERHTQALFVGEPTGGRPNHFGDAEIYPLPETQTVVLISTLRWQDSFDSDPRPWIRPDIPAAYTFTDFLAGRDPAIEAVMAHDASGIAFQPFTARRWYRDTQFLGWVVPAMGWRGRFDAEGNALD
jgi:C-terminal processing protease CtpA/Prc